MLTENQKCFIYWIKEREKIRLLKEAGEVSPWSDNPVMCNTYFCNIDREDDKVTRWIRRHWTYREGYKEVFDLAMITARIFNLPTTLELIEQPKDGYLDFWLEDVWASLKVLSEAKEKIWNGAYIISTNGQKISKSDYCLNLLKTVAISPKITYKCKTLEEAHRALLSVDGLGSFLAAQVVADLKNSKGHPLSMASDWATFSSHGPGSLRGLAWFFDKKKVSPKQYDGGITEVWSIIQWELPEQILNKLCMQNLQNCLCEYDKFMRVSTGTGRSKRKYKAKG